jgi:hypothetical protein
MIRTNYLILKVKYFEKKRIFSLTQKNKANYELESLKKILKDILFSWAFIRIIVTEINKILPNIVH